MDRPESETDARAVLADIVRRWNRGASPLSPRRMTEVYAADAVFFGGMAEQSLGHAGVEAYFHQYDDWLSHIHLTLREVEFRPRWPDVLMVQGFADFRFGLSDGRTTHGAFRASLGLVREHGEWRIQLHHVSPPPAASPVPR